MKATEKQKLEASGWKIVSATDFLELSQDEAAFVEIKLALSNTLRSWRTKKQLTQGELAKQRHSGRSRVEKMEAADPTVSLDLLMRSLLQLGAKPRDIAKAIA